MIRTMSFGGGVQSTAMLILAAQHQIDFNVALFANVGDDSEHPATLTYIRQIATPYARKHGIELVELHPTRHGEQTTLLQQIQRTDVHRIIIPVRLGNTGAPASRMCTADFKVAVIGRELRRRGATRKNPATVAIGISVDEIERAKPGIDPQSPAQNRTYPLLDLGMNRNDCEQLIRDAGLPVPPKSACWFCPFTKAKEWQRRRHAEPDLFEQAVKLERWIGDRTEARGQGRAHLCRHGVPLDELTSTDEQLGMFDSDCDSGWCMT